MTGYERFYFHNISDIHWQNKNNDTNFIKVQYLNAREW